MAVLYKTWGFVFKKEDRMESDRMFSVFTKDFGKVEVFGKAIRKINSKLRAGIEIFSFCEIEFVQGKNRKTLIDAVLLEKFKAIENSPEKLEIAFKIRDILNNFIKGEEKDEKILDLVSDTFKKLGQLENSNYLLVSLYFFWNFISVLGHAPELSKCAICGKVLNPNILYFSNKEGGVICQSCSLSKKDLLKIKSDIVKVLRLMLKKDWHTLTKLKIDSSINKSLKEISANYYNYLLSIYSFKNAQI